MVGREGFVTIPGFRFAILCARSSGHSKTNYPLMPPYPKSPNLSFKEANRSTLIIGGREFICSAHARRDEPEGDDILVLRGASEEYFLHGQAFFKALFKGSGQFLSDLDPAQLKSIGEADLVCCDAMEESRNSIQFEVSGHAIEVMGHYLDARFYPLIMDGLVVALASRLVDIENQEIPPFVFPVPSDWLLFSTAEYDEDDDWWEFIDPEDPTGEKAQAESARMLAEIVELNRMRQAERGEESAS